jgi:hypothetical protein
VLAGNAVTGEAPKKLDAVIRKCHLEALKDKSGWAQLQTPKAEITCIASIRNSALNWISIQVNDGKDEAPKGAHDGNDGNHHGPVNWDFDPSDPLALPATPPSGEHAKAAGRGRRGKGGR